MSSAPSKLAKLMSPPRTKYFKLDRDGNGLREYARRIISTPGTHDGLYWPPENQADISPLNGFVEDANLGGRSGEKPEPYNGYYFRILTAQGRRRRAAPFPTSSTAT